MPDHSAAGAGERTSLWTEAAQLGRDLAVTRPGGRSWPRAFPYALVVAATLWLWYPMRLPGSVPVQPDGHAAVSLNLAVTHLLCHTVSSVSPYTVATEIRVHPDLIDLQLRNISVAMAGSLDAYCKQARPFLNNENSLMFIERVVLDASPKMTMNRLGWILFRIKLLLGFVFALGLLRSGTSLLLVTAVGVVFLDLLRVLATHFYSIYPFVVPLQAAMLGFYLILWHSSWPERPRYAVPIFTGLGAYAAFTINMRTEFQPLVIALLLLFVGLLVFRRRRTWPDRARVAGWLVGSFVAGYVLFQAIFIWTLPQDTHYSSASHPVAHPLVLSLALPPSKLSVREGIVWNDGVGLTLARRVDPSATYLGPGYEAALFKYYGRLWREHTGEMLGIYKAKAVLAGINMIAHCRGEAWSAPVRHSMWALSLLQNGIGLLGFSLLVLGVSTYRAATRVGGLTLLAAMTAVIASFSLLLCMAIMPYFYPTYHGALAFSMTLLVLLCAQALIDLGWQAMSRAGARRQTTS